LGRDAEWMGITQGAGVDLSEFGYAGMTYRKPQKKLPQFAF
jgi:hypothetical protein